MSHSTFHPFSRLPLELRMRIWEEACLKPSHTHRHIHYVTLDRSTEMAPLNYNWDDSKPKNKSVYLWDAGLWTACDESRKVVAKQWEQQPSPDNPLDIYSCCSLKEAEHYFRHVWQPREDGSEPLLIGSRVDHEQWRQIVYPERDIFCITAEDWDSVARDCELLPSWATSYAYQAVAMEFDPSWIDVLEERTTKPSIDDLPASLGFLLRLLFKHVEDGFGGKTKLIDRDATWSLRYPASGPNIQDIDEEYIDLLPNRESSSAYILKSSPAWILLFHVERLFYDDLLPIHCATECLDLWNHSDYEERSKFDVLNSFSILVCRKNRTDQGRT